MSLFMCRPKFVSDWFSYTVGNCQDTWNLSSSVSSGFSVAVSTVGFSSLPLQWLPRTLFPQIKQPEREADHPRLLLKSVFTSQYKGRLRLCVTFPFRHRSILVPSERSVSTLSVVFSHLPEQSVIGGQRLVPSNMEPTATECIFRYLLIIRR